MVDENTLKKSTAILLWFMSVIVIPFMGVTSVSAQSIHVDSLSFNLNFRVDKSDIDFTYKNNAQVITKLDSLLTDSMYVTRIDSLSIRTTASPEAPYDYNIRLSRSRVNSLESFLVNRYPLLNPQRFHTSYFVYRWSEVVNLINSDQVDMPHKHSVLEILENPSTNESQKEQSIRYYGDRTAWNYIVENYLNHLRHSDSQCNIYFIPTYNSLADVNFAIPPSEANIPMLDIEQLYIPVPYELDLYEIEQEVVEPAYIRKPLVALKTNLLYDVATVLNVSAEVPIGKRISLAGEWIFPWWTWDDGTADSKRHRLQLLYGNLEARIWFGSRDNRPVLTGWYAGIYSGGGKYDFEFDREGVQGEFFIAAGLSAGYAHTINKAHTLRMEYSASAGYLQTDYRDYNSIYGDGYDFKWHPIRRSTGEYTFIGPTAVKVSLVWMLYYNKKVKGGKK